MSPDGSMNADYGKNFEATHPTVAIAFESVASSAAVGAFCKTLLFAAASRMTCFPESFALTTTFLFVEISRKSVEPSNSLEV